MTNPTPLSPSAQAVLDAASDVYWDWTEMEPAASHVIAATALRAAAYEIDWESGDPKFLLEAIAAELEDADDPA
jgi:hypothetical protein